MNRTEHLLECLSEECCEVGQRVSKALRFGLKEIQKGQELTNAQRIVEELHDLISVAHILYSAGVIGAVWPSPEHTAAKLAKIEKFMEIGRVHGALQEPRP
ncbi:hypothetical protein [Bosea minatitlanensis]|uniref:NTP pyrophosphohydrolase MazG putative catalytic core domain-containing protein n=1 Tax=Bosea minatitlanensis TaxID=128782 RepID=A0ABW0F363_9HYPH|nr:hypothetical protein [Bosea minatitlanensis]MCT4492687.1 hypothetical protein [Bosea minatitlanensis]